ncbi:cytochrome C biogenesis protein [Mangrovactinospora gilvigrisea]|uniref:Cytochrome C biogenesis protein n=2 Tax=Mangrovactinospora gilvigrisea TaxID=1428644 RepID=A0A1J7C7W5_9ACTN|nr:cytochrome C biogenesis protein [Mangrovactinospora gilvigrisea]
MYAAVSPFYILFAVFGIFPVGFSIFLSFQSWDGIGKMKSVGWENYKYLLTDPQFWQSIVNTLEIWVMATVPMLFLALVVAYALHTAVRFKSFYRMAYFVPNVTSMVAMAIVFGSIFSGNFGILNDLLKSIGAGQVQWLTDPWGIKVAIAALSTWRWVGYNAIIYLAGLQAISQDVYEAAKMDGANARQTFFRITIPLMRPIILFTVITSTIGGLQLFTESQVLVGDSGGTGQSGETIVVYLWQHAFVQNQFGYGGAIGWALFILIVLFSIINWRFLRERNDDLGRKGRRLRRNSRAS